jgi:hypothetical protein
MIGIGEDVEGCAVGQNASARGDAELSSDQELAIDL